MLRKFVETILKWKRSPRNYHYCKLILSAISYQAISYFYHAISYFCALICNSIFFFTTNEGLMHAAGYHNCKLINMKTINLNHTRIRNRHRVRQEKIWDNFFPVNIETSDILIMTSLVFWTMTFGLEGSRLTYYWFCNAF